MERQRLPSLDFFRGATVIAMITVNNPGTWEHVFAPLQHAQWHGCTPTDLIFPFFLFIVGVSIHFAYRDKKIEGLNRRNFLKITKRAILIFLFGLLLAWFTLPLDRMIDVDRLSTIRIPGVLQRISVVFFFTAILYLTSSWLTQLRLGAGLLLVYYFLMTWVPVPGIGPPNLDPGTNLAAWTDRLFLDGHLWSQSKTWDPEGVLSTLPALVTGILGMLTGQLMDRVKNPSERVSWIFFFGMILILSGLVWDLVFPINKSLWTSSYVLYTGGWAMQALAASHWLIDIRGHQSWIKPFLYFGMNAIFAFVASGLIAKTLLRTRWTSQTGTEESLWNFLYQQAYASWLEPPVASVAFALTLVLVFGVVLRWMYRRKWFIKV
jgi:predicted acyltransferase